MRFKTQKSNKRPMVKAIVGETKREGKKGQKTHNLQEPKKRKVNPSCCRKLFHPWPL
jgi:hypothetical protein